ncbi:MAG: hypothetical protein N2745_04940 [Syntrophorhabdaceae bacterium]|nr:hypothetical protein [Syntrophorhabdaceae bacterium]
MEDNFGVALRRVCLSVIESVENGWFLDDALNHIFKNNTFAETHKSLIYEIVSGVIRWRLYLSAVIKSFARRHIKRRLRNLLEIGLYQISFMKKPAPFVINETIETIKHEIGREAGNFANALFRWYIREKEKGFDFFLTHLKPTPVKYLSILYSYPEWIVRRWVDRFGVEDAERLLSSSNRPSGFGIRVDIERITRDEVMLHFSEMGLNVKKGYFLDSAFYVDRLQPVIEDPLFKKGLIHIQDEASQIGGSIIKPRNGEIILDACAGFGTKTGQIHGESLNATIVAMDREIKRLRSLKKKGGIVAVLGDGLSPPFKRCKFNAILLDAPCSSLGIIRKHPEIKWKRREEEVLSFANKQFNLLSSLWEHLSEGGLLVYSVCSFEPEETVGVIELFRERGGSFLLEKPLPFLFNNGYFLSLPHETGMDGFFIACLRKI